ncbi:MAG: sulfatase-like hydrolase/transferase [Acidobacteriota bacterium]|nr:sulfatase-like hydrolase/transferase [Acidobacteriota bacterium]
MTRSHSIQVHWAGALAVFLIWTFVGCGPQSSPPVTPADENVLLITVDTLRADHLGVYGATQIETPNMNRLATGGVWYEQAVAASPITLPSHATILTGLDTPHHGVRHNGLFVLDEKFETLAEILRQRGYSTAAFTGAFVLDQRYGLGQGFDHYDDQVHIGGGKRPGGTYVERDAGVVVDRALQWLNTRDTDRPFFVWLHFYDPHAPYRAPSPWMERYATNPYAGEVAWVDDRVGHLLEELGEAELLDHTLTVLTADHGEGLGQHDEWTHADLIYESTMRVPLIFSGPSVARGGGPVRDRLAATVDVLPTVLSLLDIPFDGNRFDGIDLIGEPISPDRQVHVETMAPLLDYGWSSLHGLRTLTTKYIDAPDPEFFDLATDPGELTNLYNDDARAVESRRVLSELRSHWGDDLALLDGGREQTPDERRRLQSLGYVAGSNASRRVGGEDPKTMMGVWRRMREAVDLARQKRYEDAQAAIEAVLAEQPTSARAWYSAASIYEMADVPDRVEHAMRQAVALQPRSEGYVTLARYALQRNDEVAFRDALDAAEALDPRDGGVAIGLGHYHASRGRIAEALAAFRHAIEVDPIRSGPYARQQLERLEAAQGDTP